jgi:hypothetical protein
MNNSPNSNSTVPLAVKPRTLISIIASAGTLLAVSAMTPARADETQSCKPLTAAQLEALKAACSCVCATPPAPPKKVVHRVVHTPPPAAIAIAPSPPPPAAPVVQESPPISIAFGSYMLNDTPYYSNPGYGRGGASAVAVAVVVGAQSIPSVASSAAPSVSINVHPNLNINTVVMNTTNPRVTAAPVTIARPTTIVRGPVFGRFGR